MKARSAGCVFRNPAGGASAGQLIDQCGLKGVTQGSASVSRVHANYLVSSDNASSRPSRDMKDLMALVKREIKARTGVDLQEEVRVIPYQEE